MSEHFIYEAYDPYGSLLYVGCTTNVTRRMAEHKSRSAWFPLASRIVTRKAPDDRAQALAAEAEVIGQRGPRFNTIHASRGPKYEIPESPYLTLSEVAVMLGVPRRTAAHWARNGKLPVSAKVEGHTGAYLFLRSDIDALLAA